MGARYHDALRPGLYAVAKWLLDNPGSANEGRGSWENGRVAGSNKENSSSSARKNEAALQHAHGRCRKSSHSRFLERKFSACLWWKAVTRKIGLKPQPFSLRELTRVGPSATSNGSG